VSAERRTYSDRNSESRLVGHSRKPIIPNRPNPYPPSNVKYIPLEAMLIKNGECLHKISELLGHADVGITLKVYHHVDAESIRQMHVENSPLRKLEVVGALG
jgi:integrase